MSIKKKANFPEVPMGQPTYTTQQPVNEPEPQSATAMLGCRPLTGRPLRQDEYNWLRPRLLASDGPIQSNPADDLVLLSKPEIAQLSAVMQYVRANRKLRVHHAAYRVSKAWSDGVIEIGGPVERAPGEDLEKLVAAMECLLSQGEQKAKDLLDQVAGKLLTPEVLAAYDRLIEALVACESKYACHTGDTAVCRPRPELRIAFAAIDLRDQIEHLVGESDRRRVRELTALSDLVETVLSSPLVAQRLGSPKLANKPDPEHVLQWVLRVDGLPPVSISSELAKLAAIRSLFTWIAVHVSIDPQTVATKVDDKVVIAGMVLAGS